VWIPYIRPGFALSKLVVEAVAAHPEAKMVLLAKHGLVTWGDTAAESYASTLDAINRAAAFIAERTPRQAAVRRTDRRAGRDAERADLLAEALPALRGACPLTALASCRSTPRPRCSSSPAARIRRSSRRWARRAPITSVHTRRVPVWVDFDARTEDAALLKDRIVQRVAEWRERELEYFERHRTEDRLGDPSPRVVVIQGVGLVSVGRTLKAAGLARDLYHRAINVMRRVAALGGFVSLDDAESFAIEYWPLELYKLVARVGAARACRERSR